MIVDKLPERLLGPIDGMNVKLVQTEQEAQDLAIELAGYDVIALDFETNAHHIKSKTFQAVGISFAVDPHRAWYIPFGHVQPKQSSLFAPPLEQLTQKQVMDLFRFVWTHKKIVGHNLKYECQVFARIGEKVEHFEHSRHGGGVYFDTYIAQKILDDRIPKYGLKPLTRKYFSRKALEYEEVTGKQDKDFSTVPLDIALPYAAPDSSNCFALYEELNRQLDEDPNTHNVFWNYEMPLVPVVASMEHVGMRLDEKHLLDVYDKTSENASRLQMQMWDIVLARCPDYEEQFNGPFAPHSKDHVRFAMFDVLNLPNPSPGDTPAVDKANLEKIMEILKKEEDQIEGREEQDLHDERVDFLNNMMAWRKEDKTRSTYTKNLLDKRQDGILYPELGQVDTKSGRFASRNPNGQNLPMIGDVYKIRSAFLPPIPGWVWIVADYAALEMRLAAAISGCPILKGIICGDKTIYDIPEVVRDPDAVYEKQLKKALEDNVPEERARREAAYIDVHTFTAASAYGVMYDDVTKPIRNNAKRINFGILYGISEFGLAIQLGCSTKEAREKIDKYMETYYGVAEWIERVKKQVFKDKRIATVQGRYRYVPYWALDLPAKRYQSIFRWAVNHVIQGSGGYITKKAMIDTAHAYERLGLKAREVFQIHDEIISTCPREEIQIAGDTLVECMATEMNGVPIVPDGYQVLERLQKS